MTNNENTVWDLDTLFQRLYQNEALLETLLNSFIDTKESNIDTLVQALESKDLSQIKMTAHTVKGVASQLCGYKLQHIAEHIETLSKASNVEKNLHLIGESLPVFTQEMNALVIEFNAHLETKKSTKSNADGPANSISTAELQLLLNDLDTKLAQSEYISPDSITILQTTHKDKPSLHALLSKLADQINIFDNRAASATLIAIQLSLKDLNTGKDV